MGNCGAERGGGPVLLVGCIPTHTHCESVHVLPPTCPRMPLFVFKISSGDSLLQGTAVERERDLSRNTALLPACMSTSGRIHTDSLPR